METIQDLEKEVADLSLEFAKGLGFLDLETMKQTSYRFKEMMGDDYCPSEDSEVASSPDLVSPSQEVSTRKSLCASNVLSSDEEETNKEPERKPRKSRKSVCAMPKIVMSSSDESEYETCISGNEEEKCDNSMEDDNGDEILHKNRKKKTHFLNSSSDEDEQQEHDLSEDEEVVFNTDKTKKKINYFSNSEDDCEADGGPDEIDMLSQSLKRQTINDNDTRKYTDNEPSVTFKEAESEYDSEEDSAGSLKDFVVSSDEDNSESGKDDDGSDDDDATDTEGVDNESCSDNDRSEENDDDDKKCEKEEESDSDFEEQPKRPPVIKTPAPRATQILKEKHFQKFKTPLSQSRRIIEEYCTPKAVLGTPAYKREFNKKREDTVSGLFKLFNRTVFGDKLPHDLEITWNKRMTKTAGFCYYSKSMGVRKCRLELSDKVIDAPERIRDTLIHELCHAATWLINGVQAGHGPAWKHWAKVANKIHPDLPIISRCHQYEINTKYNYKCNGCGATFGRHSKSIDPSKHRCATCGGIPELQGSTSSTSATPKTPNAYALFVKEHFANVKKSNPGKSHRDIMVLISDKYKSRKASDGNKENV